MARQSTKEALGNLAFRTLDLRGLLAAAAMGAILVWLAGIPYFLLMLVFFLLSAFFTRFGERRKGVHGPRGWENVVANGSFATIAAIFGRPEIFFGAMCAVAADKMAGEVGQTSTAHPRMITDLKRRVVPGTNGGVSFLGEVSATATGVFFGALAFVLFRGHPVSEYLLVGAAIGFSGANFDSLLGAILENRGHLTKHGVNFLASVFGGVLAVLLFGL